MKKLVSNVLDNPIMVLFLGACPAMAAGASALAALTMGIFALVLLVIMSLLVTALKKAVAEQFQIPVYVLLATVICVALRMVLYALFPRQYLALGLYTLVLAVSLVVYAQVEYSVTACCLKCALKRALVVGLFFTAVTLATGLIREIFGASSVFGIYLPFMESFKIGALAQPYGGFLAFAIVAAIVNKNFPGCAVESGCASKAAGLED